MNQVRVELNKGKDFSGNTIELIGDTDPGSYIVFSGVDYSMYARGASTFFTEYQVVIFHTLYIFPTVPF